MRLLVASKSLPCTLYAQDEHIHFGVYGKSSMPVVLKVVAEASNELAMFDRLRVKAGALHLIRPVLPPKHVPASRYAVLVLPQLHLLQDILRNAHSLTDALPYLRTLVEVCVRVR